MQVGKRNDFLLLPSASRQILSGNSGYLTYTLERFVRQSSSAHSCGQNCSFKFTSGKSRERLVELSEGLSSGTRGYFVKGAVTKPASSP